MRCIKLLVFCGDGRDKRLCDAALAAALDIEVAEDAEGQSADEVDEQILHRVVQADVQIPVKAQVFAVDGNRGDPVDRDGDVLVCRVEHDGGDRVHDRVLLHVHVEQPVHAELKEFPQHADRHRKAECDERHVDRRQLEFDLVVAVEDIDQRKAEGRAEEARRRMQDRIPVRYVDEKAAKLAQNLRGKDEDQDDDLQRARQLDAEVPLHEQRQQKQKQHQQADRRVFIFSPQDRRNEDRNDDQSQNDVDREHGRLLLRLCEQPQTLLAGLFLHILRSPSLVKRILLDAREKNKIPFVKLL